MMEDFLEPPHHHDPLQLLIPISQLPIPVEAMEPELQIPLLRFYRATSIAFASIKRMKQLHRAYCRLLPDAEHDFLDMYAFNAKKQLDAEKRYFDKEVLPEWRQNFQISKAQMYGPGLLKGCHTIALPDELDLWWKGFEGLIKAWAEEAERIADTDISGGIWS
jgi:hypothetical protein